MDPFGMQVEASYRKADYESRAAQARLIGSIQVPRPRKSWLSVRRSVLHPLLVGLEATPWLWRRTSARRVKARAHPEATAALRPVRRRS